MKKTDEQMKKTDEQMKKTDEKIQKTEKMIMLNDGKYNRTKRDIKRMEKIMDGI
jgi:hypothetical protein